MRFIVCKRKTYIKRIVNLSLLAAAAANATLLLMKWRRCMYNIECLLNQYQVAVVRCKRLMLLASLTHIDVVTFRVIILIPEESCSWAKSNDTAHARAIFLALFPNSHPI